METKLVITTENIMTNISQIIWLKTPDQITVEHDDGIMMAKPADPINIVENSCPEATYIYQLN